MTHKGKGPVQYDFGDEDSEVCQPFVSRQAKARIFSKWNFHNRALKTRAPWICAPLLAQVMIAHTPLSPEFTVDGLEHFHATSATNRTTGGGPTQPPPPPGPVYSYTQGAPDVAALSHQGFSSASMGAANVPVMVGAESYDLTSPVNPGLPYMPAANFGWQSPNSHTMRGGDASQTIAGASLSSHCDFQYRQPQTGGRSFDGYVSPATLQNPALGFEAGYAWAGQHDRQLTSQMAMGGTVPGRLAMADENVGEVSVSPEAAFSAVEQDPTDGAPEEAKAQRKKPRRTKAVTSPAQFEHRGSTSSQTTISSSGSNNTAKPKSTSKLRSASRTSKNTVTRPSETPEERKSRNSHNLVEKQYRNRLNAQFESLLNALPDNIRGSGTGDESDGPNVDLGDKRVSKAEVLDMARRHIRSLERDRDALEQERDELLSDIQQMREDKDAAAWTKDAQ
ncbi:uncharacterized protein E0L32_000973 [Thyridium curvatum]|uniref:BHLH domain-containing protein n=1 Tax=Thyridium curvatum TaxID=1093900 RepID=A0A507AKT6_9PEZI|nr:uncharacterized protein E0L32_000973 [Thyridium curvatum]TPX11155.1 hypothetical protein E0L32_000973 [Thyridium curvatum]